MVYEDEDTLDDASFAPEEEKKLGETRKKKKPLKPASKAEKSAINDESQSSDRDRVHQKLRNYLFVGAYSEMETYMMENVATQEMPHPWIATPWSEKRLKRALSRCVTLYLSKAFGKFNAIDVEISEKCHQAAASISQLNDELVTSILVVGNFTKEVDICAKSTCVRYMVGHADVSSAVEISEVQTACTVDGCHKRNTTPRYIVLEDGKYEDNLEFDGAATQQQKVITLCREHSVFFELMCSFRHMFWNIHNNCLTMVRKYHEQASPDEISFDGFQAWLPTTFGTRLVASYMARYHTLWAFGSPDDWLSRGYTINHFLYK